MHGPQTTYADAIHSEKYRLPGETFRDAMSRVASALQDSSEHYYAFRDTLLDMRFMPAGRVQAAMGSPKNVTAQNCYASGTIPDSFVDRDNPEQSSIMHRAEQAASTMRMGGGIGYDFSTLRPAGALIQKLQSRSSGPLGFMPIFNEVCKATSSAGNRRGAQMGVLRVDHPDVHAFIAAKHNSTALTGFNISVAVTDDFMDALAAKRPFDLRFGGQVYSTVDPAELWEMLMRSTWDWAEPGVLFIDTINRMNNLWYCETIAATNPCVPAGTPILTRNGWQAIDELVGASVEVWNGEEWSCVVPKVTGHNQKLVTVYLSDGRTLRCTPAHRFLLADGRRLPASDLEIGDKLLKHSWPVIESGSDNDMAYQQGFFSGDGWFDSRGRAYVGLYGEKKALVDEFAGATISREYAITGGYEGTDLTQTRIYASMCAGRMLPKEFVPDTSWSVASRLEWLAGLMDADGCAVPSYNSVVVQISSKDRDFLSNVQLMLNTLGVASTLTTMKECWRLGVSANNLQRLTDLGLHLRRLDVSGNNPQRDASRFVSVVAVVDDGDVADVVYCFTEEKRHAGCFNGVLTGQCGEQPLPPFGACLLGSFNLVRYLSQQPDGWAFDWDHLHADIPHVVRAMDNVVDRAIYPLPEQRQEALNKRRMGLGVTGLANAAEAMGMPYGSASFLEWQDKLLAFITHHTYWASVDLAKEKGAFPLFDADRYCAGQFVRTLDSDLQAAIRRYGIRNSHLTSIAPTGTISLAADNVSSSIEPVYRWHQERTVLMDSGKQTIDLYDYGFAKLGVRGRRTSMGEVSAAEHVAVLTTAQRHVDSAVSKTVNCDRSMPWDAFKGIYLAAYEAGAKGCTTFNKDGKRAGLFRETPEPVDLPFPGDNALAMQGVVGADAGLTADGGLSCEFDPATGRRSCE